MATVPTGNNLFLLPMLSVLTFSHILLVRVACVYVCMYVCMYVCVCVCVCVSVSLQFSVFAPIGYLVKHARCGCRPRPVELACIRYVVTLHCDR
jgi:hypothetical protein